MPEICHFPQRETRGTSEVPQQHNSLLRELSMPPPIIGQGNVEVTSSTSSSDSITHMVRVALEENRDAESEKSVPSGHKDSTSWNLFRKCGSRGTRDLCCGNTAMVKNEPISWFNEHRIPGKLPGNAPRKRGARMVPKKCGTFRAGCPRLDSRDSSRWITAMLPTYTDTPSCV